MLFLERRTIESELSANLVSPKYNKNYLKKEYTEKELNIDKLNSVKAATVAVGVISKEILELDMICRSGGLIGAITNGGFAEYAAGPEKTCQDT